MSDRYILGAYWSPRAESLEQCSDRLRSFLSDLAIVDESLSQWLKATPSSRKSSEDRVDPREKNSVAQLLESGRNRENARNDVMEDLGFQVGLWNGRNSDDRASMSVRCGLSWQSSKPNVSVGNCVIVDLPKILVPPASEQKMTRALAAAAQAWKPDWAGVMSESSMLARNFDAEVPFVDWMVFVPRKVGQLLGSCRLIELSAGGSIVIVPRSALSAQFESDAQIRSRVETALLG